MLYFITIVECDFNLSVAAEKAHVSQPALSKFIIKYEDNHNLKLFYRRKGRLTGLTKAGEILYQGALRIQRDYDNISSELENLTEYYGGTVTIGIPPLILSTLFVDLLSQFINLNPNVKFNIVEKSDRALIADLERGIIDFCIILQPNSVNNKLFEERVIYRDHLSVFLKADHELADRGSLSWEDLDARSLIMANTDFRVGKQIYEKIDEHNISPIIKIETSQSSFAIELLKHSDYITILPDPLRKIVNLEGISILDLDDEVDWIVSLAYTKKSKYSVLEKYITDSIIHYFDNQGEIKAIDNKD